MSETNNKLEIKKLSKRFGEKILFENLSLTVDGPAVLWAPSGWGKTTLLRILMGLEAPTSGSVEGVGRVGAVFQEDRLCPQLTAEENVALVLTAEQYKVKTQYKEQIRDDLIQLGLDDEALALPARKLSGGQKRRTALLRALWHTTWRAWAGSVLFMTIRDWMTRPLPCLPGSSPADRSAAPPCCARSGPRATRFC